MNETFETASQLIRNIFHLVVQKLDSSVQIQSFSRAYMLHEIQQGLTSDALASFLKDMKAGIIYHVIDEFQMHYLFALVCGQSFAIGPFCSAVINEKGCIRLLNEYHIISHLTSNELMAYRSQYPVIDVPYAQHIARSFLNVMDPSQQIWENCEINCSEQTMAVQSPDSTLALRKNYSELIQERYQLEQRFMYNLVHGNAYAAVLNLRSLQQDVAFFKRTDSLLENERIGAAIVRTDVRIAAMQAGLPAVTVDLLSRKNTAAILRAKTVGEIYKEKERMVEEFCREIRSHQTRQYSNLISSTIYYMEHQYPQNITIQQMAEELNVSVNHLIAAFRQETGRTPGNYLRQIRLREALRLLCNTDLSIQDIGVMTGIPDANYFIKLFKKEYDMTPGQYRKYYRL